MTKPLPVRKATWQLQDGTLGAAHYRTPQDETNDRVNHLEAEVAELKALLFLRFNIVLSEKT